MLDFTMMTQEEYNKVVSLFEIMVERQKRFNEEMERKLNRQRLSPDDALFGFTEARDLPFIETIIALY